jgi:hypothetical protein
MFIYLTIAQFRKLYKNIYLGLEYVSWILFMVFLTLVVSIAGSVALRGWNDDKLWILDDLEGSSSGLIEVLLDVF